jgi:flagellar hook protein FlgE
MFGSIFIGLSGMNAFSGGLKQISNNITNINTTGFKSNNLSFSNLFGENGGFGRGVGQGVLLGSTSIDFAQGELRQSDRDLDLAIDGGGFMVLLNNGQQVFTRTGSFEVDNNGFIVLAGTDYRLAVLDDSGKPTAVSIEPHRTSTPKATTHIKFADNLSSTATNFTVSNIKIFDSLGASDTWQVRFERDTAMAAGEWRVIALNGSAQEIDRQTLRFINGIVDPTTAKLTFTEDASGKSVLLDFSTNVSSFSSGEVSTLRAAEADGYGVGAITNIAVNAAGQLEISYSNEQKKELGAVAIASFRDPQTLEIRDGGLFMHRGAMVDYLTSAHDSVGRVTSRRLEASNVELSQEFGDLILVQRGFQASSQIVSASNDMIQQLFGIRGQG